jgi:HEAT repeat protein
MKNWSTSTKVTVGLVVVLLAWAVLRSMAYDRMAMTIAHEVATPSAVSAARKLVLRKKLARVFKDRTEQAKKQAIRTTQVLVADRAMVAIEGHHMPMAEAASGALVEFLSDLELPVRAAAADALGRMGKAAARPLIDQGLTSPDKDVRSNASRALLTIGDVAVPEMVATLGGGSPSQKIGCAGAVGKLRATRATGALIGALSAKEEDVRLACRDALVALGKPAVKPLLGALTNKDAFTRQHACEALGEIADKSAAAPLLPVLDDENRLVRLAATYAIGKLKDPQATAPLIAKLADKDREIREAAAVSLGQIADPAAVNPLVAALSDGVDKVREQAAAALGRIDPTDPAVLAAIEAVTQSSTEGMRAAALTALGLIGQPQSASAIAARLDPAVEGSVLVRRRAAQALGELKSAAAVGALLKAFGDPDWRVNYTAQRGLAALGTGAVDPLLALMAGADGLRARYARKALVGIQPAPVAPLAQVLTGGSPAARLNATLALGEIGNADAQKLLAGLAKDADPAVAEAAKRAKSVRPAAVDALATPVEAPASKAPAPTTSEAPQ